MATNSTAAQLTSKLPVAELVSVLENGNETCGVLTLTKDALEEVRERRDSVHPFPPAKVLERLKHTVPVQLIERSQHINSRGGIS